MKAAFRKVFLVYEVLAGRLDVNAMVLEVERLTDQVDKLYKIIDKVQLERQYWHDIWRAEGREYHAAQHRLIEEVTNLRRKLGDPHADALRDLEFAAERQRHELLVDPPFHPTPSVKTPLGKVDSPPLKHVTDA